MNLTYLVCMVSLLWTDLSLDNKMRMMLIEKMKFT